MNTAVMVDGRNFFAPEMARGAGFDYTGIGRAAKGVTVGLQAFASGREGA